MTATPPTESARTLSIAADIADAVDPMLTAEERIAAADRACRRHPQRAMRMIAALTYGMLASACERDPDGPAAVMQDLRARLAAAVGV